MSKEKTFAKVDKALSEGALWRAKEILQGNIAHGYDCEIYERYGQVLLQMGDLPEAGKYLFLSGKSLPEYEQAISIYLKRHTKLNPFHTLYTFPKAARLPRLSDYPETVEQYLRSVGHSDNTLECYPSQEFKQTRFGTLKDILILVIFLFCLVLVGHLIWSFFAFIFSMLHSNW